MTQNKNKTFVISLGGSLIVPSFGIDVDYLKSLNLFIRNKVKEGKKFIIICGGGKTCREYQEAAKDLLGKSITPRQLDWLGIYVLRANAQLVLTLFSDLAFPEVVNNFEATPEKINEYDLVIGGAESPGFSTDFDSVLAAQSCGSKYLINLSNVDYIYDKDPKVYTDAVPLKKLTWSKVLSMFDATWQPGMNRPFDPVAAKKAQALNLKVVVANGRNFKNLDNIIDGKNYIGTTIS